MIKYAKYTNYLKTSAIYFVVSIANAVLSVLVNPLMAMNLSYDDYAVLGYYSSFNLLFTPLVSFSLATYYLRNYYKTREEDRRRLSDTVLIGMMIVGFISFVVFLTAFYFFSRAKGVQFDFMPYAVLNFGQLYFAIFTTYYLTRLRMEGKAVRFARVSVFNTVMTILLGLLLVVALKLGAAGKLYSALAAAFAMAVFSVYKSLGRWQFDKAIFKDAIRFGLPLTCSALLWYFYSGIDRVLLEPLNDTRSFGLYSVGLQMAGYLTIFYTSINNAFEPDIYKSMAENNMEKMKRIVLFMIGFVAVANLAFIALAPYVISILTANRYTAAAPFARILALQNITMAIFYMVAKLFVGYGYVRQEVLVRIVGAVLSVGLFTVLIHHFGFYGAAWGQVFSFLIMSLLGLLAILILNNRKCQTAN